MAGLLWYRSYMDSLANTSGYYPDIHAGHADRVTELTLEAPYLSRAVPSGYNQLELAQIIGGTMVVEGSLQSVEATAHLTVGKNLMNPDWSAWTVGNLYAVLADVVPNGAVARITLEDNDTSVSLSGCNMGFAYEDTGSAASQYRWVIANGVVQSNMTNISVVDGETLCSNMFIYPKTEATLNKFLARYNIMVELGTTATTYEPYAKATYPLANITLRGISTTVDGVLSYDGDTYEPDGTVTRYYGTRAYQAGDENLPDAVTDGTNTVYKLTTPVTESEAPYTAMQTVEEGGKVQFVTSNNIPVGNVSIYRRV